MSEDPVAQRELAALPRRYEQHAEQTHEALATVKSDILHLRVETGTLGARLALLERRFDAFVEKHDSFVAEQRATNAAILEMLTQLGGRKPEQG